MAVYYNAIQNNTMQYSTIQYNNTHHTKLHTTLKAVLYAKITRRKLPIQYCLGDKIEKNEMGGECSAYGGEERRIQGFGG